MSAERKHGLYRSPEVATAGAAEASQHARVAKPTCGVRHERLGVTCTLDAEHDGPHCPLESGPRCSHFKGRS